MRRVVTTMLVVLAMVGVIAGIAGLGAAVASRSSSSKSLGYVAWSSAVTTSRSARSLTLDADVADISEQALGCNPLVRPRVHETRTEVQIRVEVINRPLPSNVACGGSGVTALPVTVHLAAALGRRTLVDARNGSPHPVLAVDTTPTLHGVPAPFTRRITSWDEDTGAVGEWWRWQVLPQSNQIDLQFAPNSAALTNDPPPRDATHVYVQGMPATIWTDAGGDLRTTTITWTTRKRQAVRMTVLDESRHPLSQSAALAIAGTLH